MSKTSVYISTSLKKCQRSNHLDSISFLSKSKKLKKKNKKKEERRESRRGFFAVKPLR